MNQLLIKHNDDGRRNTHSKNILLLNGNRNKFDRTRKSGNKPKLPGHHVLFLARARHAAVGGGWRAVHRDNERASVALWVSSAAA